MAYPVLTCGTCQGIISKNPVWTAIYLNPPARSGLGGFLHRRLPRNSTCSGYASFFGAKNI